jgi:hypothetical protein
MDHTEWVALAMVAVAFMLSLWMLFRKKGCGNSCSKECSAFRQDSSGPSSKKSTQI